MSAHKVIEISAAPEGDYSVDSYAEHENNWYSYRDFDGHRISEHPLYAKRKLRVICVGAGATGIQVCRFQ